VFILNVVKVLCFDTLLQVLILKVVKVAVSALLQLFARGDKSGLPQRHRGTELGGTCDLSIRCSPVGMHFLRAELEKLTVGHGLAAARAAANPPECTTCCLVARSFTSADPCQSLSPSLVLEEEQRLDTPQVPPPRVFLKKRLQAVENKGNECGKKRKERKRGCKRLKGRGLRLERWEG
jgi:hypothetical protein